MKSVLFVGDASYDISARVAHIPDADEKVIALETTVGVGGVAANSAVAASLTGAASALAAPIGTDRDGDEILRELTAFGIDLFPELISGDSARSQSWIDQSGEKHLVLSRGVGLYPSADFVTALPVESFGWVHTAIYDLEAGLALAELCHRHAVPLSLDLEPATIPERFELLRPILAATSMVFVNTQARRRLHEEHVDLVDDLGIPVVVETLGARGAHLITEGRELTVAGIRQAALDTTGAGDCLAGWFIGELQGGTDHGRALTAAVTAASLSCTALGGARSYPDQDEVDNATPQQSGDDTQ